VKKKDDISLADKKVWEEYTKNPKDIFDKDIKEKNKIIPRKRFRFDLHGYTLDEANTKVRQIIIDCQQKGFNEILLITGKGLHSNTESDAYVSKDLSKLKFSVPEYLNTNNELSQKIISIEPATIVDGGEGAILVKLRKL